MQRNRTIPKIKFLMKLAIISDIHSNCFALERVIEEINKKQIEKILIIGDTFGYYPWATETFNLLDSFGLDNIFAITGNHDELILNPDEKYREKSYFKAAVNNRESLKKEAKTGWDWLNSLQSQLTIQIDNISFNLIHGTPDDHTFGRFYPDNNEKTSWWPKENEVLILGHTHYPLLKQKKNMGIVINPGSVGQPRDGNTDASWATYNTGSNTIEFQRTNYDIEKAVKDLVKMDWDNRAILALKKNYNGALRMK